MEEKNNASHSRCKFEYVMEDEEDEQHTGKNNRHDEEKDQNNDGELDSD